MSKHTISLPEPISSYVEARLAEGRYSDLSDYIIELLRKDQSERKSSVTDLQLLLEQAEASGLCEKSLDEIFADVRLALRA